MPCKLRSYDISPPGGFPYVQEQGIRHVFPSIPMIEDQARNVAAFRRANNLDRSSVADSLADVDAFQCKRLGCMTNYCVDTENPSMAIAASAPVLQGRCKGCGAPVS